MSIDHGATAVALVDASANFLIMIADDEELYASTHRVDDLVDTERRDIEHHIAIDDALPILQHEVGTSDDNHITNKDDAAERDVAVLVDDGRHDVGATCGATESKSQANTRPTEHRADDGCHEGFVV